MPGLTDSDSECDRIEHYHYQVENSAAPSLVSAVHTVVVPDISYHTEVVEAGP